MGKPAKPSQSDQYRSWAKKAVRRSNTPETTKTSTIPPTYSDKQTNNEAGRLNEKQDGRGSPSSGSSAHKKRNGVASGGARDGGSGPETTTGNDAPDAISQSAPPPAPPPNKSENEGSGGPAVMDSIEGTGEKPTIGKRMLAGSMRFVIHMKNAICHSWVNVLLVFVPIGIAVELVELSPSIVFAMNAIAVIPLAGLLAHATEAVASRLGDTLGALLNVSFGNAVELIIFIIALVKKEIEIVQASLLGSILANLLLILGMAFLFGGLRYREQVYNSTVTQMSACLLSLSVTSLLLPVCCTNRD